MKKEKKKKEKEEKHMQLNKSKWGDVDNCHFEMYE